MKLDVISLNQYYYPKLSIREKCIYDKLLQGFADFSHNIMIETDSGEQLERIYHLVEIDNPMVFYVQKVKYVNISRRHIMVCPKYRFDIETVRNTISDIKSITNKICQNWIYLPELQKEEKIHEYFVHNVRYDKEFKESSFEAVGPLLFGRGVCEGISKAVKILLDFLNIHSILVMGKVADGAADIGKYELHAWNIVWIENVPYHLDVTFDMTIMVNDMERFDYFNLSDTEIQRDHMITMLYVPHCITEFSYYKRKGLFMYNQKDLKKLLKQVKKEALKNVIFQLPYQTDFEKMKEKVLILVKNSLHMCLVTQTIELSYNETQCVFHLYL